MILNFGRLSCELDTTISKTVSKQFVKVDSKGFHWNNKLYTSPEDLVSDFKNEIMKLFKQ